MAHLHFRLERPGLTFKVSQNTEEWILAVTGKCFRVSADESFVVKHGGKEYEGFGAAASIFIEKRPPITEMPRISIDKPWDPSDEHRDTIFVRCPDSSNEKPFFEISVSLPLEAYQRVRDNDWTKQTIQLSVQSGLMDPFLRYGNDPDGRELNWLTDEQPYVFLEEVTVYFLAADQGSKVDEEAEDEFGAEPVEKIPTHLEQMLASVGRATTSIESLRSSIIKAAWLLAAVVFFSAFIN